MSQVLDSDKSLSNAVSRVIAWLAAAGEEVPSGDTGGYSKARKRLPLSVLKTLFKRTAEALPAQVKPEQRWCGRQVKAYDGTTVTMSDTAANQSTIRNTAINRSGAAFHWQNWWCGFV
jgi:hypothetical protein